MSDHRNEPIRRLFDEATAHTTSAPTLDDIDVARRRRGAPLPSRRRAVPATIGLAAAAIVALLVIVPNRPDESVRTSGSVAVESPSAPSTSIEPATPTSSVVTTAVPRPTVDSVPALPTTAAQTVVVLASSTGVSTSTTDGPSIPLFDGDILAAQGTSDDRIVALRAPTTAQGPATFVVWDPRTRRVEPLDVPNPTGGELRLHDVATVNGKVTILYEYGPLVCDVDGDDCDLDLATFEPDTGESTGLLALNGARSSWKNLSLADTGIVVGEIDSDDGTRFHSGLAGLDVTAGLPDATALGLATSPPGCVNCPTGFVVDQRGRYVGWIQGPDIVVVDLVDPARRALVRAAVPDAAIGVAELDIDGVEMTTDAVSGGSATLSWVDDAGQRTSVLVGLTDPSNAMPLTGRPSLG